MRRTTVDIDDGLVDRVRAEYGLRGKRQAVNSALRRLLVDPMGRKEALALRGTGREGDLGSALPGRPAWR